MKLFDAVSRTLAAILLPAADIRHIGATAVPGCLTKGDLDIVVRVSDEAFKEADAALASNYVSNEGSIRTNSFSALEDASSHPISAYNSSLSIVPSMTFISSLSCSGSVRNSSMNTMSWSAPTTASTWSRTGGRKTRLSNGCFCLKWLAV